MISMSAACSRNVGVRHDAKPFSEANGDPAGGHGRQCIAPKLTIRSQRPLGISVGVVVRRRERQADALAPEIGRQVDEFDGRQVEDADEIDTERSDGASSGADF